MKIHSVFPSKYVKATDLEGKPAAYTTSHIEMETMGFGEDKKTKSRRQGHGGHPPAPAQGQR